MNGKRQKIQPGLALQPRDWGEPSVGGSQGVEPSMAKSTLESPAPTDRMSPSTLNPVEPPWYGPVCPVVWEGRHREVPPYPDARSSGRGSTASPFAAPPPASPPVGSSSQIKAGQSSSTSDTTVSAEPPRRSDDELNSIPANRRAVRTAVWNRSSNSSRVDLTFFSSRRNCAFSDSSRALPRIRSRKRLLQCLRLPHPVFAVLQQPCVLHRRPSVCPCDACPGR